MTGRGHVDGAGRRLTKLTHVSVVRKAAKACCKSDRSPQRGTKTNRPMHRARSHRYHPGRTRLRGCDGEHRRRVIILDEHDRSAVVDVGVHWLVQAHSERLLRASGPQGDPTGGRLQPSRDGAAPPLLAAVRAQTFPVPSTLYPPPHTLNPATFAP